MDEAKRRGKMRRTVSVVNDSFDADKSLVKKRCKSGGNLSGYMPYLYASDILHLNSIPKSIH